MGRTFKDSKSEPPKKPTKKQRRDQEKLNSQPKDTGNSWYMAGNEFKSSYKKLKIEE